jgi:hypothetical protein
MHGNLDSKTIPDTDVAGLSWRVTLDYDTELTEPEGDCGTARQVAAFRAGEWRYVIVGVSPIVAGVELDDLTETLAGVEYGTFTLTDEDDNVQGIREIDFDYLIAGMPDDDEGYPVPDLIREAKSRLAGMAPVFANVFGNVKAGLVTV